MTDFLLYHTFETTLVFKIWLLHLERYSVEYVNSISVLFCKVFSWKTWMYKFYHKFSISGIKKCECTGQCGCPVFRIFFSSFINKKSLLWKATITSFSLFSTPMPAHPVQVILLVHFLITPFLHPVRLSFASVRLSFAILEKMLHGTQFQNNFSNFLSKQR